MKTRDLLNELSSNVESVRFIRKLDSFSIYDNNQPNFIEPDLNEIAGELSKKTKIVLITAAGATGKTALAKYISFEKRMPILDLSIHKAVGEDSFSGLLTTAFDYNGAGEIKENIKTGKYCVIIEAIDEGRLKTTDEGLNSFIENIADIANESTGICFLIFGRYQVLESIWINLDSKSINSTLLEIQVFSKEQATRFIDQQIFSDSSILPRVKSHIEQYTKVKELIINSLSIFFDSKITDRKNAYEKFIGYAPVLIAISELLKGELNFHKLYEEISSIDYSNREVELLFDIVIKILTRERIEKVIPRLLPSILVGKETYRKKAEECSYSIVEQCSRVISYINSGKHEYEIFDDIDLQIKYEDQIAVWLKDHPFLKDNKFQNSVFEAYSLALMMINKEIQINEQALTYMCSPNYKDNHLLFVFYDKLNTEKKIYRKFIPFLTNSIKSMDSKNIYTEINIESIDHEDVDEKIDYYLGEMEIFTRFDEKENTIQYESVFKKDEDLIFNGYVRDLFINVPCGIILKAQGENLAIGPSVSIRCNRITIDSNELTPGNKVFQKEQESYNLDIVLETKEVVFTTTRIRTKLDMTIMCENSLGYPLGSYTIEKQKKIRFTPDDEYKYNRFRRIVMALRSHSKGSLARYHKKIEHQRVLKNEIGRKVLDRLIEDRILTLIDGFYHWNSTNASKLLEVTWEQLRKGIINEKLFEYLRK